jgi:hypothetical protein
MKNLKDNFCFTGPIETNYYLKFSLCWNEKLNVLPKILNLSSSMLYFQILKSII